MLKFNLKGLVKDMKVLLLKDVYKLGRAGEIKRVADGYGHNYLLPKGLAILATVGAIKQAESIRVEAASKRNELNLELSGVAEQLTNIVVLFPARASETGKLYGSINAQMVAENLSKKVGIEIKRHQLEMQPLRSLGTHKVPVRLTVDLIPEVNIIVHREGETPTFPEQPAQEGIEATNEIE